jgi:hypothetical protein
MVHYNRRFMTSVEDGTVSKDVTHTLQNNTTTATLIVVLTVLRYLYIIYSRCNTTYCNFSHWCGSPHYTVDSISMASNIAAMDLM